MGRTLPTGPLAALFSIRRAGEGLDPTDGLISSDGRVWGTYLHGCLDALAVRNALVGSLGGRVLSPLAPRGADYRAFREAAYDSLADALRRALNQGALRTLIGR